MRAGLALVLISLPFQLNSFVFELPWGKGFLNPYTSIFISVTEILLLITGLLFFSYSKLKKNKILSGNPSHFFVLLLFLSFILSPSFLNPSHENPFLFLITVKLFELFLLYVLIVNKILSSQEILRIFVYSLAFQSLLASVQLFFQTDLGLQILGEPELSKFNPHLARFRFAGMDILRAYGTFPHPNILAGYLATGVLLTFLIKPIFKQEWTFLLIIQFLGIFATFSRSAILALSLAFLLLGIWYLRHLKKRTTWILLIGLFLPLLIALFSMRGILFFKETNWIDRLEGFQIATELFLTHPWGLGFARYTLFLDLLTPTALMPWEYQPVHSAFLLTLVETGVQGFVLALFVVFFCLYSLFKPSFLSHQKKLRRQVLLALFTVLTLIALFDHYLISLDQGRYLLLLFFALPSLFAYETLPIHPLGRPSVEDS